MIDHLEMGQWLDLRINSAMSLLDDHATVPRNPAQSPKPPLRDTTSVGSRRSRLRVTRLSKAGELGGGVSGMMISAQTHRLRTPSSRRSSFRIDYNVSERSFFLGDSASEFGIETRALSTKVKLAMAIGAHRGDFVWFVWAAVAEAVEMMDLKEKGAVGPVKRRLLFAILARTFASLQGVGDDLHASSVVGGRSFLFPRCGIGCLVSLSSQCIWGLGKQRHDVTRRNFDVLCDERSEQEDDVISIYALCDDHASSMTLKRPSALAPVLAALLGEESDFLLVFDMIPDQRVVVMPRVNDVLRCLVGFSSLALVLKVSVTQKRVDVIVLRAGGVGNYNDQSARLAPTDPFDQIAAIVLLHKALAKSEQAA